MKSPKTQKWIKAIITVAIFLAFCTNQAWAQRPVNLRTDPGRLAQSNNLQLPGSSTIGNSSSELFSSNSQAKTLLQSPGSQLPGSPNSIRSVDLAGQNRDILNTPLGGLTGESQGAGTGESQDGENLLEMLAGGPEQWTKPKKLSTSIQVMLLLTVLTLAPSILLMTTCFVRVIVVLGLLRQAIGAQQLPPSQVITALSIFITILVMAPVWNEVRNDALIPYTSQEGNSISLEQTINRGVVPLKRFMSQQIAMARNVDDIWLFHNHLPEEERQIQPKTFADVPFKVLLPAYMISELKVAFLLGFQIYLPFLVIDIVVSSIAISMGMMMLPPVIISLPFKLILFVLVDGWRLVVGMLMASFIPYS